MITFFLHRLRDYWTFLIHSFIIVCSLHSSIHSLYPRPSGCIPIFSKLFFPDFGRMYFPYFRTLPKSTSFNRTHFLAPANSEELSPVAVLQIGSRRRHATHRCKRFRGLERDKTDRRKKLQFKVLPFEMLTSFPLVWKVNKFRIYGTIWCVVASICGGIYWSLTRPTLFILTNKARNKS
jgi:hypothetical protein